VKLTTHPHLVPRSRMRGAMPPLTQYVFMAWCLVKHRDNFTLLYLYVINTEDSFRPSSMSCGRKGKMFLRLTLNTLSSFHLNKQFSRSLEDELSHENMQCYGVSSQYLYSMTVVSNSFRFIIILTLSGVQIKHHYYTLFSHNK